MIFTLFSLCSKYLTLLLKYEFWIFFYGTAIISLCYSVVFGNSNGLAVVDYLQKHLLLNMGTSELYSPSDPYQKQPRSPRKTRQPSGGKLYSRTFLWWLFIDMYQVQANTSNPQINAVCLSCLSSCLYCTFHTLSWFALVV